MENIDLIKEAIKAQKNSYSPYSKYPVGVCIEAEDGKLFFGCNIENSAYGVSNCGERTALFSAVADGYKKFRKIAIVGGKLKDFAYPCGACRQALSEFAPDIEVVLGKYDENKNLIIKSYKLSELLPHSFGTKILTENFDD